MAQKYQLTDKGQGALAEAQQAASVRAAALARRTRAPTTEDIQSAQPFGLPPDWEATYRSQVNGPNGEKPLEGQQGWDAVGRRYYGGGLAGALRGIWARLGAPIQETPSLAETLKPVTIPGGGGARGSAVGLHSVAPGTTVLVPDLTATVNTLAARASNLGRAPGTEVGFNIQSVPTLLGRGASEIVRGMIQGLQQFSKGFKRYVGGAAAGLAEAGTTSPLPTWAPNTRFLPEQFRQIEAETFPRLDPIGLGYNLLRTVTSGRPLEEIGDIVNLNIQAARMFYTSALDPMAKQEFLRRYAAGEDPNLLAIELENPLFEAIGETIFDPLWVLGGGLARARDARRIASASDEFIKFADDGVRVAFEGLGKVADEGKAIEAVGNLAQAQVAASNLTRAGLDTFGKDTGLFSLTATGKRFNVARRFDQLAGWVAANSSGPEETLEIYRGLALANSGDPAKVALGIDILNNFKVPRPLYSRAGNEAGILLNDLIGDNPQKFLDDLAEVTAEVRKTGDIAPLVEHVNKGVTPIIDKMFPTITERIAAGEKVSDTLKALSKFDGVARSQIMRPINTFFSAIYMGMSPGYAFRNLVTNTIHIFVDEGPGAFRFGPKRWLDEATDWLGGRVPKALGYGPVAAADVKTTNKLWNTFMKISEKFEIGAAKRVIGHSISKTMRKMLQPGRAIPDVRPLLEAGMPKEAADLLMRLVADNRGNLGRAEKAFREAVKAGSIESFRNVSKWASPEDLAALHDWGLFDDANEALKLGTPDEAAAAWAKSLDDFRAEAAKVQLETSAIPEGSAFTQDAASLGAAREAGHLSDEAVSGLQAKFNASDRSIGDYQSAANELARQAYFAAGQQQIPAPQVERIAQGYRSLLNGEIEQLGRLQRGKFWNEIFEWKKKIQKMPNDTDWGAVWKTIGIEGEPPIGMTRGELVNELFRVHARPTIEKMAQAMRDQIAIGTEAFAREMGAVTGFEVNTPLLQQARASYLESLKFDNAAVLKDGRLYTFGVGGELFQIPVGEGIDNTRHLLNAINANLPEGMAPFENLHDISPKIARAALEQRAAKKFAEAGPATVEELVARGIPEETARAMVAAPEAVTLEPLVPPLAKGAMPSHARAIQENLPGLEQLSARIEEGLRGNWGSLEAVAPWGDEVEAALIPWLKEADGRIAEARLIAEAVAQQARDFTLLLYPEKRNIDLALSYLYPYNFWYSRTYANWLKRVVSNPEVLANYGRYREALEKIHAGAPEWWKYNINSNELLGLDSEHPLFFNLEATLNPLNGLVGVDFDDPYKRTGWFTTMLQEAGKLGPSTWTPYSWATALALYMKGENEAAARWAGRMFPQTATIRAASALAVGKPLELDPFVHWFSGGVGPFERRRAGRALAAMDNEHKYPTADILDAAYQQRGPIWEEALLREATERGPGQLASFFLGVGFRARSQSDMEIDRFYGDWQRFWAQEPDYSPEEVRQGIEAIRKKYPFMDALLLSRKGGLDRDRAFAYNVLGRIPPAQTDDFAELVGVPAELLSRFYESKGHIEQWPETDKDRFMAGILDLAAVLDMPNTATRSEWNEARGAYQSLLQEGERRFGAEIWSRVDAYFGAKGDTPAEKEAAERILSLDPAIGQALDWRAETILRSQTLSAYYNSIEKVEQYYKGLMYDAIEKELGKDIWEKWDVYWFLQGADLKEARAYYKAHPELKRYGELKDAWVPIAEQKAIEVGRLLPEGQGATLRQIKGELGIGALEVQGNFPTGGPGAITPEMWQAALGGSTFRLVMDFLLDGTPLPVAAQRKLETAAQSMGIPGGAEGLMLAMRSSLQESPVAAP